MAMAIGDVPFMIAVVVNGLGFVVVVCGCGCAR